MNSSNVLTPELLAQITAMEGIKKKLAREEEELRAAESRDPSNFVGDHISVGGATLAGLADVWNQGINGFRARKLRESIEKSGGALDSARLAYAKARLLPAQQQQADGAPPALLQRPDGMELPQQMPTQNSQPTSGDGASRAFWGDNANNADIQAAREAYMRMMSRQAAESEAQKTGGDDWGDMFARPKDRELSRRGYVTPTFDF